MGDKVFAVARLCRVRFEESRVHICCELFPLLLGLRLCRLEGSHAIIFGGSLSAVKQTVSSHPTRALVTSPCDEILLVPSRLAALATSASICAAFSRFLLSTGSSPSDSPSSSSESSCNAARLLSSSSRSLIFCFTVPFFFIGWREPKSTFCSSSSSSSQSSLTCSSTSSSSNFLRP